VLYLSDVPLHDVLKMPSAKKLAKWRVPQLATESVPAQLGGWVLVTPVQFLAVSAGLGGLWAVRRRMKRAAERAAAAADDGGEQS